jgi:hypothetical protein
VAVVAVQCPECGSREEREDNSWGNLPMKNGRHQLRFARESLDLWRCRKTAVCSGASFFAYTRLRRAAFPWQCCLSLFEFVKLCGARALFRHFTTLPVIKIVKFLGKIDGHPE